MLRDAPVSKRVKPKGGPGSRTGHSAAVTTPPGALTGPKSPTCCSAGARGRNALGSFQRIVGLRGRLAFSRPLHAPLRRSQRAGRACASGWALPAAACAAALAPLCAAAATDRQLPSPLPSSRHPRMPIMSSSSEYEDCYSSPSYTGTGSSSTHAHGALRGVSRPRSTVHQPGPLARVRVPGRACCKAFWAEQSGGFCCHESADCGGSGRASCLPPCCRQTRLPRGPRTGTQNYFWP